MARSKLSLQQRIESHIVSKDDCWLTDLCCPSGYPRFSVNGKMKQLSHITYQLYNGEIPEGFIICHKCDNPACINPNHLFLGTPKDNSQDMVKKGRSLKGKAGQKGSKHGRAKLNEEKVQEIKRLLVETNLTHKEIAGLFGVTERLISHIKAGENWSHVVYSFNDITVNGNVNINNYSENKQLSLFDVEKFN